MALSVSRRQWLAGVAGAAAGIGAAAESTRIANQAFLIEPDRVTITRHRIGGSGGPNAGAPPGPRLHVVQLSDLHLEHIDSREERVAAAVASLRPDLVVLTGDAIDHPGRLGLLGEFLDLLDAGTRKLAILGNREHSGGVDVRALERVYERRNAELLRNDVADLLVDGRHVLITGLDSLIGGTPDPARALVGSQPTPNHLLLAHCPAQRDKTRWAPVTPASTAKIADGPVVDLAPYRPQWMLSGHTHGGQIAPFGLAIVRPRGSGRYVGGWYRDAVPALYVSRGLGTSFIPARYRSPPEVAFFEWWLV